MDQEVIDILGHIAKGHNFLLSGGAGSGKTYTLVQVIRAVLQEHKKPIACMTYTNAAANEIEHRVNHKLLNVSTIHDFLWDNIKNYQNELKHVIIEMINSPEDSLNVADCDTPISEDFFDNRENSVDIKYAEYVRIKDGIISHDEVLRVAKNVFSKYKKVGDILKSRYPFIFIDEYQDTHPEVVEILLDCITQSPKHCIIGFVGDSMQAIYDDGIGSIKNYLNTIDNTNGCVYEVQKKQNRRCPRAVIDIANKIRFDGLFQEPSIDITAPNMIDGHVKQGSAKFFYTENGENHVDILKEKLCSEGWDFDDTNETKELRLTHNLIAGEAGFGTLMEIHNGEKIIEFAKRVRKYIGKYLAKMDVSTMTFNDVLVFLEANETDKEKEWKPTKGQLAYIDCHVEYFEYAKTLSFDVLSNCFITKDLLIDDDNNDETENNTSTRTTLSPLNLHLHKIEKCLRLYTNHEYSEFMKNTSVGFINKASQKRILKDAITRVLEIKEMTIGEVIDMADRLNICKIDDKPEKYIIKNPYIYYRVRKVNYSEHRHVYDYIMQRQPFSTQHKTKGLEYSNVLVILNAGNWPKYNYESLFNPNTGKSEAVIQRTKKLFYVCCTRAKNNLIVYYPSAPTSVVEGAKSMFGEDNIFKI